MPRKKIRGNTVRVGCDNGMLDIGLINLSRRHGVVSSDNFAVYRNSVQVASLAVGEQGTD